MSIRYLTQEQIESAKNTADALRINTASCTFIKSQYKLNITLAHATYLELLRKEAAHKHCSMFKALGKVKDRNNILLLSTNHNKNDLQVLFSTIIGDKTHYVKIDIAVLLDLVAEISKNDRRLKSSDSDQVFLFITWVNQKVFGTFS